MAILVDVLQLFAPLRVLRIDNDDDDDYNSNDNNDDDRVTMQASVSNKNPLPKS